MRSVNLSSRTQVAISVSRTVSILLKTFKLGEGATLPGRVLLSISPNALVELSSGLKSVLISGTNAKTTTTALANSGLSAKYDVISNITGANMREGITFALGSYQKSDQRDPIGLFEVDERYLASIGDVLKSEIIALLNLSRDQLDRVSETRITSLNWRKFIESHQGVTVVANCDDPLIVYSAEVASRVVWVEAGLNFKFDAKSCPKCGSEIQFSSGNWFCSCGFQRPQPFIKRHGEILTVGQEDIVLNMRLPGNCNVANGAIALGICHVAGVDLELAAKLISGLDEVAGRYKRISYLEHQVRMLLTKNPAGWVEVFDLIGDDKSVVIGINAQVADGKDPSWLWDVPFELLRGKEVIATGERASDLSVRLYYAEVSHKVVFDPSDAVSHCSNSEVSFVGNYTCFQQFRKIVEYPKTTFGKVVGQISQRVFK